MPASGARLRARTLSALGPRLGCRARDARCAGRGPRFLLSLCLRADPPLRRPGPRSPSLLPAGPDAGKLGTIVDVIDHTRALVDSPAIPGAEALTGFGRAVVPMKWVALTPLTVGVKRNAKAKSLVAAWAAAGTVAAWAGSKWGKTLAGKAAKVKQTDFQRFEAQLKAQAVATKVRKALAKA